CGLGELSPRDSTRVKGVRHRDLPTVVFLRKYCRDRHLRALDTSEWNSTIRTFGARFRFTCPKPACASTDMRTRCCVCRKHVRPPGDVPRPRDPGRPGPRPPAGAGTPTG